MGLFAVKDSLGRPVFLNLFVIALPVTAFVSILHRVTGVFLIATMPYMLLQLYGLVLDAKVFWVQTGFWIESALLWAIASASAYHLLAGLRHLYHDYASQHSLSISRVSAYAVLIFWGLWCFPTGVLWLGGGV